jgi:hypothetical protein
MKKIFSLTVILLVTIVFSCKKEKEILKDKKLNLSTAADTVTYVVSMTPAQVVELYEDADDLKNNCASYQLADALRANMTTDILEYVYDHTSEIDYDAGDPVLPVLFEDLFNEFPELEEDLDDYISTHTYNQPHEFNSYNTLKAAYAHDGESLEPAIWMPHVFTFPNDYTPSASNYILGIEVDIDEEDADSEDEGFAWNVTGGVLTTIGIGETAAKNSNKGIYMVGGWNSSVVTGGGSGGTSTPPFSNSNPWGSSGSGSIRIHRLNMCCRFEANGRSEIRCSKAYGSYQGAFGPFGHYYDQEVYKMHKDDIGTNKWIPTPYFLTGGINNTEDVMQVFNLYEYDWKSNFYELGDVRKAGSGTFYIAGWRKYRDHYYLEYPNANSWSNEDSRISSPDCYDVYNSGEINRTTYNVDNWVHGTALLKQ